MSGVDFSGLDVHEANFENVKLDGTNFRRTGLYKSRFADCNLENHNFSGADLARSIEESLGIVTCLNFYNSDNKT